MFLRRNRRKFKGDSCEYWTLVESVRTSQGPRQRLVATVGKLPGLNEEARVGWEHTGEILDGRAHQSDFLKAEMEPPAWARVLRIPSESAALLRNSWPTRSEYAVLVLCSLCFRDVTAVKRFPSPPRQGSLL